MTQSKVELRDAMKRYGKLPAFSEKEQVRILYFILNDAKSTLAKDTELYNLIAERMLKLKDEVNLKNAIKLVNAFIIEN